MKQTYILIPQNEGQELNCRVTVQATLKEAGEIASKMAMNIQSALLLQCNIGVMIQTQSEGFRGDAGIIAKWDGTFSKLGNPIKL